MFDIQTSHSGILLIIKFMPARCKSKRFPCRASYVMTVGRNFLLSFELHASYITSLSFSTLQPFPA